MNKDKELLGCTFKPNLSLTNKSGSLEDKLLYTDSSNTLAQLGMLNLNLNTNNSEIINRQVTFNNSQ
jgi:hypothetical protein